MRAALVVVVLLLAPLAGCTVFEDGFGDDPEPVQRTFVTESFAFDTTQAAPTIPPSSEGDLAQHFNVSFDVPAGATDLVMRAAVTFSGPDAPDPAPQGDVQLNMRLPDDRGFSKQRQRSGTVDQEIAMPPVGTWTIDIDATGQGRVELTVTALVPPE